MEKLLTSVSAFLNRLAYNRVVAAVQFYTSKVAPQRDRYTDEDACVYRLIEEYHKHGSLYIAFDYDNTVFDCHSKGDTYEKVENILRLAKKNNMKLVLFTANDDKDKLEEIVAKCTANGYAPDYVNESPLMDTKKPFVNLLLDDRAGLPSAYRALRRVLNFINLENAQNL